MSAETVKLGENVSLTVDGKNAVINIDLSHRGQKSEKGNYRVASTLGNKRVPGHPGMRIGLNIFSD